MNKPKKCCYPNCFECPYVDCRYDHLERQDIISQDKYDKELEPVDPEVAKQRKRNRKYAKTDKRKITSKRYFRSDKGKEAIYRYNHSDRGKERADRYNHSEKRKKSIEKYLKSEKGQQMLARKRQRRKEKINGKQGM